MKNIVKVNKTLGWILVVGIAITQIIVTKVTFDMGRMAPFYAFLLAVIFLPFVVTAITSVLNRERSIKKIKIGIIIGLFFQVALPIILPLFFDKEFIYLSLIGIFLGIVMWTFRNKIEVQLLILNGIGASIWLFISLAGLLSS
ncbi:hypothetical protein DNU06_16980 [Putridiphycobacter roseus]|uniref:Uncharacterized protein n=1 Tax=Putridiphycobacter roseus TaxID=2219161 RepID=A0A2W1MWW0_9FLAO|nr:hypothetical protein [Putridiphycobacter roseus]PZE15640.1 hypothetical protein DNU06_16980 [Putridiphycobacter roseus]